MKMKKLLVGSLFLMITMPAVTFVKGQTEAGGGGRVGGSMSGNDSTYKPKVRAVAKRTVPKRTTRPGKTAAQYEADGSKFFDDKDYDSSLVAYQSAVAIRPSAVALYRIGWIQNDFGEFATALTNLDRAILMDPRLASAYVEKNYALRRLQRPGEATMALKKCVELNPQSSKCHYELGRTYYDQRKYADAVSMLSTATSIDPEYGDAFEHLGVALRRTGRNEEAIDALNRAIELEPQESGPYMGLGDVYYYGTKDYGKAIEAYIKGLEYDPDNEDAAFNVGWAYNDLGNYYEAITYLTRAVNKKSDYASAFNELGFANLKLKRYAEASNALKRSLALEPKNEIAHYYTGQVYLATNDRNGAMAEYRTLQGLNSSYAPKLLKMISGQ
jgi:tetratricopeptide (TPR) repeat protein